MKLMRSSWSSGGWSLIAAVMVTRSGLHYSFGKIRVESSPRAGGALSFVSLGMRGATNQIENEPPEVTLYVVPDCPLCARAREWLTRHQIAYRERDVARDFGALRAMHRLTRQRFVPVFEFGARALVRPSERELEGWLLTKD